MTVDDGKVGADSSVAKKRVGVLVVAYNAATTLAKVLDRIPAELKADIEEVIVSDDHSQDSTYLVGLGYQQTSDLPITLIRQPTNLGYGGNQKAGYRLAIEHGLDIVVMLHGDGQYAPESLPEILGPLLHNEADAVFGSRTMIKGAARRGGMPLYKFVGNRILSRFENGVLGTDLSEFHWDIVPTQSARSSSSPSSRTAMDSISTRRSSSSCTMPVCVLPKCPSPPTTATRSVMWTV